MLKTEFLEVSQDNFFHKKNSLNIDGKLHSLSEPKVMGILNITPNSFYDGGKLRSDHDILKLAEKHLKDGAYFLDIGGYSTKPGADDVAVEEEINRVCGAGEVILKEFPNAILSVDTFRSKVAESAVNSGFKLVNDVSGGNLDESMFDTLSSLKVPYILMHMRGTPQNMQSLTDYDNLARDIISDLSVKVKKLTELGVHDVIIDPGFGFSKTIDQNFELLNSLDLFHLLELPLLVGLSRKSSIYKTLETDAKDALNGTTVLNTIALQNGASILRVHDVKEAVEAIKLTQKIKKA
jgi:dihydropteroate synthase